MTDLSLRRFWAAFTARNREFLRDRAALTWNLLLPALIVLGFAFAFGGVGKVDLTAGVIGDPAALGETPLQAERVEREAGLERLRHQRLDLLVDPAERIYWVNPDSDRGRLAARALTGAEGWEQRAMPGEPLRYVDWLVPGILAMNMMFSALYGVGYVIVRYRKNGVLKRLSATPLTAFEFLAAQVASRWWLLLAMTAAVYLGTWVLVGFPLRGSPLALVLTFACGGLALISLGLLASVRLASEEMAEGVLNLLAWPMMFLSGVWFATDRLHPWLQEAAWALPLTHVTHAARAVMLDGAGVADIAGHLLVLLAMAGALLAVGARLFRWE
ncbi:ABC transporter permease [Thiohalospira sp.]|uniref:ABC transporter permease n=1 Tax=Thiohalospira sp. TaxID=3080549 RepID=UPI00398002FE